MRKTHIVLTFILTILISSVYAIPPVQIDYYGVLSQSDDQNMLKMAQDIFFTQLKSIDNAAIDDKRSDLSVTMTELPSFPATSHFIFYAELRESPADAITRGWECTFNILDTKDSKTVSKTQTYESYYSILVSSKTTIEELLSQATQSSEQKSRPDIPKDSSYTVNLDSLAGNWSGEPYTDKIVILRGGRGFVIFKNGASMNISVTVNGLDQKGNIKALKIRQTGRPNASFFPSLPRETALNYAAHAKPIEWELTLVSPDTLKGTKKTAVFSASANSAVEGTEEIIWSRK